MRNIITSELVVAYEQCRRKAFLLLSDEQQGKKSDYISIQEEQTQECKEKYMNDLVAKNPDASPYSPEALEQGKAVLFEASLDWEDLQGSADLLTRKESDSSRNYYEPTIIVGDYNISKEQKLPLYYLGHLLSKIQGQRILSGNIVTPENKTYKIKLENVSEIINPIVSELRKWKSGLNQEPPAIILNKHCPYCPFEEQCLYKAKEIDHLSLLKGIGQQEIENQNRRGIFTIAQYSYTYRPHKAQFKGKRPIKYHHSLKALSIRNRQIYVVKKPEINISENLILIDVEGIPHEDRYYLIGILAIDKISTQRYSFWAENRGDERRIWYDFLAFIERYQNFSLIHYGKYEAEFVDKMSRRYPTTDVSLLERIKSNSLNLLSVIYAKIYFPTYSNGLKEIGEFLGHHWPIEGSSGLQSIVWRHNWGRTKDEVLKQKLIEYNIHDCIALEKILNAVMIIMRSEEENEMNLEFSSAENSNENFERGKFKKNKFALSELERINNCAYFDYQRDRIYFRNTDTKISRIKERGFRDSPRTLHVNTSIEIPPPSNCPTCGNSNLSVDRIEHKFVLDLKFFDYGVQKWVIKYFTKRMKCRPCGATFHADSYAEIGKYGHQFGTWVIYQQIVMKQSYRKTSKSLYDLFRYNLSDRVSYAVKGQMIEYYRATYQGILQKLRSGHLVHIDETKVSLKKETAYVWVFTSLEEVIYVYSPTREASVIKETIADFSGVMVSDFYPAYDSIECAQQRCLIHLIRDMNEDLLQNPFDEDYKDFVKHFSILLKSIIETIDTYGLRKQYLAQHKSKIDGFFDIFVLKETKSEITKRYQKRFISNKTRLFTFLDYDDVPWNNNNAEYAIKEFAIYRKLTDGFFTEGGIKDHLILLSIYKTCEYKRINFLDFLLSREKDIEKFRAQQYIKRHALTVT